jgi:hypothetical protein
MFPFNNLTLSLLETPLSRCSENNRGQILNEGCPIVSLYNLNIKNSNSKVYSRSFKDS